MPGLVSHSPPAENRAELVDEAHSRSGVDVAVTDTAKAATVPVKRHLGDQEPAVGIHLFDMPDVSPAACPLHMWLEDNRCAHGGLCAGVQSMARRIPRPGGGVAQLHQRLVLLPIRGIPRAPAEVAGIPAMRRRGVGVVARRLHPLPNASRGGGYSATRYADRVAGGGATGAARTACGYRGAIWHPGGIIRNDLAIRRAMPVGGAVIGAIGPPVAVPAIVEVVASLVMQTRRGVRRWGHLHRGDA